MVEQFIREFYFYVIVISRLFPVLLFAPGFGETFVLPQLRILMALLFGIVITPLIQTSLPSLPPTFLGLVLILGGEVLVGLFLALIIRSFMYLLEIAGSIISQEIGFSNVLVASPISEQQASILGAFLSLIGLLIVFTLSLHHLFIYGVVDSYTLFKPGFLPPIGDFSQHFTEIVNKIFRLAVYFSAPFLMVNLIFYIGMGLLSRLVTQIQVFFIAMPLQLLIGIFVLFLSLATLFTWYQIQLKDHLSGRINLHG